MYLTEEQDNTRITTLVQQEVRRIMQEQQRDLLQTAASNSGAIIARQLQDNTSQVIDTLDSQLLKINEHETKWKGNINKNNFDFAKQVEDLWATIERAVNEGRIVRTKELIETGKNLRKQGMKVLHLADKEG